MPIYEYKCKSCEHKFDKIQKIADDPLVDCPDCGAPELVKLISAAGFRLKGTGWYETDFKNSNSKAKDSTKSTSSKSSKSSASD